MRLTSSVSHIIHVLKEISLKINNFINWQTLSYGGLSFLTLFQLLTFQQYPCLIVFSYRHSMLSNVGGTYKQLSVNSDTNFSLISRGKKETST